MCRGGGGAGNGAGQWCRTMVRAMVWDNGADNGAGQWCRQWRGAMVRDIGAKQWCGTMVRAMVRDNGEGNGAGQALRQRQILSSPLPLYIFCVLTQTLPIPTTLPPLLSFTNVRNPLSCTYPLLFLALLPSPAPWLPSHPPCPTLQPALPLFANLHPCPNRWRSCSRTRLQSTGATS